MKGHRVYIRKVPRKHTQRLRPVNCPQACGVVQRPGYKIRTNWRRGHRPDSLVVALIDRQGAAPLKDRSPKHSSESISEHQAAFAGDELKVVALEMRVHTGAHERGFVAPAATTAVPSRLGRWKSQIFHPCKSCTRTRRLRGRAIQSPRSGWHRRWKILCGPKHERSRRQNLPVTQKTNTHMSE